MTATKHFTNLFQRLVYRNVKCRGLDFVHSVASHTCRANLFDVSTAHGTWQWSDR